MNSFKKSFGKWCEENNLGFYIDYWVYEINGCSPYEISYTSHKREAFWCGNLDHSIFYRQPSNIVNSKNTVKCQGCESFGQSVIDIYGRDYLDAVWSDKNDISPFDIRKDSTSTKVWLKCLDNNNHPDYDVSPHNFLKGSRCPYCSGKRVCFDNSLAKAMPEIADLWSDKNKDGPDKYSPASDKGVWLKCGMNKHEDFIRRVANIKNFGYECPECMRKRVADIRSEDLTGQVFGRLTVIGTDPNDLQKCICECNCENHSILSVSKQHLKSGWTISCGCYHHERVSGENSHLWKGGITEHGQEGRYTTDYTNFRKDVMERDNFACQSCGKVGSDFEVHHFLNYSTHEDLRFDTTNAITFCKKCHSQNYDGSFHKIYGLQNNTPEQVEEFINSKRKELGIDEKFSIKDFVRSSEEYKNFSEKRTCACCGGTYDYYPHFDLKRDDHAYDMIFDSEICKEVFETVSAYKSGIISCDSAKRELSNLDIEDMEFTDDIQSTIDEIFETTENNGFEKIVYRPGRGLPEKMVANLF